MLKNAALILAFILLVSCGGTETWIPIAANRPAVTRVHVQYLENPPQRPHTIIGIITPPAGEIAFNRIAAKLLGIPSDEAAIARGEKALPGMVGIIEGQLAGNKWITGGEFSLVDCAYVPTLNIVEKAGFSFADFPKVAAYLDACRARPAWKEIPKLPGL